MLSVTPGGRSDMPDRKQRFMEKHAPKWGDQAAELAWRIRGIRQSGLPAVVVIWVDLLVRPRQSIALLLIGGFLVLSIPQVVLIIIYGGRMNRAASEALGVKVGWSAENSPPSKSPVYENGARRKVSSHILLRTDFNWVHKTDKRACWVVVTANHIVQPLSCAVGLGNGAQAH